MLNFLNFMRESVSNYHACLNIEEILIKANYQKLEDNKYWNLEYNKKYYIKHNSRSIIAFTTPAKKTLLGSNLVVSHVDSPTFKIKPQALLADGNYIRLNTEVYGGPILSSWYDKPLSIAGQILIKKEDKIEERFIYIDKDLLIIPSVPPHLDPKVSKGTEYNLKTDVIPLLGIDGSLSLLEILSKELNISYTDILDFDLCLVNRQRARLGGYNNEFIFSPQIDDLASVYATLDAFIKSENHEVFNFYIAFDNEEVGSMTSEGADSSYLRETLTRIMTNLSYTYEEQLIVKNNSFVLSCDNAHAVNPNHTELFDPNNRPYLGKGVVLKYNSNYRYTTTSISASYLKLLASKAKLNLQAYTNRRDLRGGSTLGALLTSQLAINSADIGLPQLAMHSSLEVCAAKDLFDLVKLVEVFYNNVFKS